MLSISVPVTKAGKKKEMTLARVPYIHYSLRFWKDTNKMQALIDFDSKVNIITLIYVLKLGLRVRQTKVKAQKIDGSTLETFKIVLASFQLENKLEQARFF